MTNSGKIAKKQDKIRMCSCLERKAPIYRNGNEVNEMLNDLRASLTPPQNEEEVFFQEVFMEAQRQMWIEKVEKPCKAGVLGYKRVFLNKECTSWEYEIDYTFVIAVDIIYTCALKGMSLKQISLELLRNGFTKFSGEPIKEKFILGVLRNPIYKAGVGHPDDCMMCKKDCKKKVVAPLLIFDDKWNDV